MSRKILLTLALFCLLVSAKGQNLQLHFDPRSSLYGDDVSGINYLTATFEFFKPDQWGNTFMFVDFDFSFDKRNPGLIYGEIAREFKIGDRKSTRLNSSHVRISYAVFCLKKKKQKKTTK